MKKRSRQGLRRFRVEVHSWTDYVDRILELERSLAKRPGELHIEIVGTGEISADSALRFRAALLGRSPQTRIVTHARSSLQGGSVLLWLMGETRTIRDDARICFRQTTLTEHEVMPDNGARDKIVPMYRDSYSAISPDEGDYARVLELINEYLPVDEMAGRLIDVPLLRQFGLIENEKVDTFLAAVFAKPQQRLERPPTSVEKRRPQRTVKSGVRQTRSRN